MAYGDSGILATARPGTLLIDMSTIRPQTSATVRGGSRSAAPAASSRCSGTVWADPPDGVGDRRWVYGTTPDGRLVREIALLGDLPPKLSYKLSHYLSEVPPI